MWGMECVPLRESTGSPAAAEYGELAEGTVLPSKEYQKSCSGAQAVAMTRTLKLGLCVTCVLLIATLGTWGEYHLSGTAAIFSSDSSKR